MTLLAPYDDSALSARALERANQFAVCRDEELVALTVVPESETFAEERGWIESGEEYDPEAVESRFQRRVDELAPAATFRSERPPDGTSIKASVTDRITMTVRRIARDVDADIVFIGSDNAGRVWTPATSVGGPLSEDPSFDVHIVRQVD